MTPDTMPITPTVSILVTVFNRQKYLAETLRSIGASSYQDWEAVVVDDCSTDDSFAIAQEFGRADRRFRIIRNEHNLGDYGNRMKAAGLATGRFLKYVDSDDQIYPYGLQVMVDAMSRFPDAAVGLAHSMPEDMEPYPWCLDPEATYRKHFLERGCLGCGPSGAIIRRDLFEQAGGFRKDWGVLSDTELWLRLAASHPIVLLPPALVWWRRHAGQEFTRDDAADVYLAKGHNLAMKSLTNADCPLKPVDRMAAVRRCKQHHARRLLSLAVKNLRPATAYRLFRGSQLSIPDLVSGLRRYHSS
ncbi:MAG: glycosyltransferase family 2 protein [Planctomycetaceae bacterium]|nr:glycosyltransferase family 2 protein [Planctomycetaceae bacterium]